jgi:hypothetical protein
MGLYPAAWQEGKMFSAKKGDLRSVSWSETTGCEKRRWADGGRIASIGLAFKINLEELAARS